MPEMIAMQLDRPGEALHCVVRPIPTPGPDDLLIEVRACGVCRTDIHVIDGEVAANQPVIQGHEIVGIVA